MNKLTLKFRFKIVALTLFFVLCGIEQGYSIDWSGKWIWQTADGPANSWVCFRKTIDVDVIPENVIANIAVDSKYWLWINGEMVVFEGGVARGPSRAGVWNRDINFTPSNSWYEEVDIKPYLKQGKNTIALLVWYWGRETFKGTHIDSDKGGLLFNSDIGGTKIVSDGTWKVKQHPGYDTNSGDNGTAVVQYRVKYNAQTDLGDWSSSAWYTVGYDDSSWLAAVEKGVATSPPWYDLEKTYVPRLLNHGLSDYENNAALKFPFVSNGNPIVCQLPFNKQVTPYFEIEGAAGKVIEVTTDNSMNKISANYTTKNGLQSFECFSWMNGQSVKYTIPAGVTVKALKYRWMSVGEMAGSFETSDAFYQRLWWMGRNTLFVCARDNFMDCPDRERALWIGDVADQSGYIFYTMDNAGRQQLKKTIYTAINFSEDGVIGCLGPFSTRELPAQSLQFIAQLVWNYYLNTGDLTTLKDVYSNVNQYLALWEMQSNGLPKYRKWQHYNQMDWTDWGDFIDKEPIQFALYYMALESAKKMAIEVGVNTNIEWYNSRMTSISTAFNTIYWKNGFYSSDIATYKDDRLNALTILSGIADSAKFDAIVQNVLIPNKFASPHFEWMVEAAMCTAGKHKEALNRMKERYGSQVNTTGLSTLYETFPKGGTYNHAWNASNTVLSKYIAGIEPTKVGWSEYSICPNLVYLTSLKEVIPTVKGDILVDIKTTSELYTIDLTSPIGTMAIVGIPKTDIKVTSVKVGGTVIWENDTFIGAVAGITWNSEDSRFLKFNVTPGTWSFVAERKSPIIYFVTPNDDIVKPGSDLVVKAGIIVAPESIESMSLYVNNVLVSTLNEAPFLWENIGNTNTLLNEIEPGNYTLKLVTTVGGVTSEINKTITAPVYAYISSPKNGDLIEAHGIEVSATLNADIAGFASLALLIDDKPVRTISAVPFEWGKNSAIDAALMDLTEGVHKLTLITTNNSNKTFSSSVSVTIKHPIVQKPFGTLPIEIPGLIEAENYDLGGEGFAYHDTDGVNLTGELRSDGVDIEKGASGYVIGNAAKGEWLEYTINVSESGEYDLRVNYSAFKTSGSARISVSFPDESINFVTNFVLPQTAGLTVYKDFSLGLVNLTKGTYVLRITVADSGFNLDWIKFSKITSGTEIIFVNGINVYPNPSNTGIFNLTESQKWQIYTIDGTKIMEGEGTKIDLSDYNKGIYIGKFQQRFFKLVKE